MSCRFCGRTKAARKMSLRARLQMNILVTVLIFLFLITTIITHTLPKTARISHMPIRPTNACVPGVIKLTMAVKNNTRKSQMNSIRIPTETSVWKLSVCFFTSLFVTCWFRKSHDITGSVSL